ncbi:hypothetical protein RI054_09g49020 [Pseudoscourfieldia marina]
MAMAMARTSSLSRSLPRTSSLSVSCILHFLVLLVASSLVATSGLSEVGCVLCEPARAGDVSALTSAINSLDPASRTGTAEQRAAALDAADAYGWPALFWAVDSGHEEVVDVLLSAGANPNTFHRGGWNALMWAAGMPSPVGPKLVTAMCKHYSADVALTSEESNKMTALMVAARSGAPETVRVLIDQCKAHIAAADSAGTTAIMLAASSGRAKNVNVLLEGIAPGGTTKEFLAQVDSRGWTALAHAAAEGHAEVAEQLVAAGATTDDVAQLVAAADAATAAATSGAGNLPTTPLALAASRGHANVVRVLLASAVAANDNGDDKAATVTSLTIAAYAAARAGRVGVLEALAAAGAGGMHPTLHESAAHAAARGGNGRLVAKLLSGQGMLPGMPGIFAPTPATGATAVELLRLASPALPCPNELVDEVRASLPTSLVDWNASHVSAYLCTLSPAGTSRSAQIPVEACRAAASLRAAGASNGAVLAAGALRTNGEAELRESIARVFHDPVELLAWAQRQRSAFPQVVPALLRAIRVDSAETISPALNAERVLCMTSDDKLCGERSSGACELAANAVLGDGDEESRRTAATPSHFVDASDEMGTTLTVESASAHLPPLLSPCDYTPLELAGLKGLRAGTARLRRNAILAATSRSGKTNATSVSDLVVASTSPSMHQAPAARLAREIRLVLRSHSSRLAAFTDGPLAAAVADVKDATSDSASAEQRTFEAHLGSLAPGMLNWLASFAGSHGDALLALALEASPLASTQATLKAASSPLPAFGDLSLCDAAVARLRDASGSASPKLASAVLAAVAPAANEWARGGSVSSLTAAANAWPVGVASCVVLSLLSAAPEHPMLLELHGALSSAPTPMLSRLQIWGGGSPNSFARDCSKLLSLGVLYNMRDTVEVVSQAAGNLADAADAHNSDRLLAFAEKCHAAVLVPWRDAIKENVASDAAVNLGGSKVDGLETLLEVARAQKWWRVTSRVAAVARASLRAIPVSAWDSQQAALWFAASPKVGDEQSVAFEDILPQLVPAVRACKLDGPELTGAGTIGGQALSISAATAWPGAMLKSRVILLRMALARGSRCGLLANEVLARATMPCTEEWSNGPSAFELAVGGKESVLAAIGKQGEDDVADLTAAAKRLRPSVASHLSKRNVTAWSAGDASCWLSLQARNPVVWLARAARMDVAAPSPLNGLALTRLGKFAADLLDTKASKMGATATASSVTAPLGMNARTAAALSWTVASPGGYIAIAAWALASGSLRPVVATASLEAWRTRVSFGHVTASPDVAASPRDALLLLTPDSKNDGDATKQSQTGTVTPLEQALFCSLQPCAPLHAAALKAACMFLVEEAGTPLSWTSESSAAYIAMAGKASYSQHIRADGVSGRRLLELLHHSGLASSVDAASGAPGLPRRHEEVGSDSSTGSHACDHVEVNDASIASVASALSSSLEPIALARSIITLGRSADVDTPSQRHLLTHLLQSYPDIATATYRTERGTGTLYGVLRGMKNVEWVEHLATQYVLPTVQVRLFGMQLHKWKSSDIANHLYAKAEKLRAQSPPAVEQAAEADRTAEALLRADVNGLDFVRCHEVIHGSDTSVAPPKTAGAEVEDCLSHPKDLLRFAASEERPSIVRFLFKSRLVRASDATDQHGHSLLLTAAWTSDEGLARVLLENGVDADVSGPGGQTALHRASLRGNAGIVRLLLSTPELEGMAAGTKEWHVDVSRRNNRGKTAMMLAKSKGHAGVEALLHAAPSGSSASTSTTTTTSTGGGSSSSSSSSTATGSHRVDGADIPTPIPTRTARA